MQIAIMVEGNTEKAFKKVLLDFLASRCVPMPKLTLIPSKGPLPRGDKLQETVADLLRGGARGKHYDFVVALTDVQGPSGFQSAHDARTHMRQWVGNEERFFPHAAQHDFEAWLLPYWDRIRRLSGCTTKGPSGNPEGVNHQKPPARWLHEAFRAGGNREYIKPRDAARILEDADLLVAARACPELKAFLNTLLTLCGGTKIP